MADDDTQTQATDQQGGADDTQSQNDNGQQDNNGGQDGRDDATRQQIADDVRQDAEDKGKTLTQSEVDKIVADRIARERKKFADYDDLKKAAARLKQIEDANKSELEKIKERETALAVELQRYKVAEVRRAAASAAGLDPEFAEFITAADEDEAKAQAEKLAERLKASTSNGKSADFKQGPRTSAPAPKSRDDILRAFAGYGR